MHLLPFDILVTPDGRYAIEKYSISYLSSGRDLLKYTDRGVLTGNSAVILADPDYDAESATATALAFVTHETGSMLPARAYTDTTECLSGQFRPLPATDNEGKAIARLLEERTDLSISDYYGAYASEEYLKNIQPPPPGFCT